MYITNMKQIIIDGHDKDILKKAAQPQHDNNPKHATVEKKRSAHYKVNDCKTKFCTKPRSQPTRWSDCHAQVSSKQDGGTTRRPLNTRKRKLTPN